MTGSSPSFKRQGLSCAECGAPFALSPNLLQVESIQKLSDPFRAKCPECGHEATYPKSAIQILVAVGNQ